MEESRTEYYKGMAAVLMAVAGLVTATAGWFKPRDDTATKVTYEQLSTAIKQVSEDNVKLHDNLVAMRGYLEGLRGSKAPDLSGMGEGGGSRGEGIGLGSIGTLGHGAGTGTGQGFGSGSGRLGGSARVPAAARAPTAVKPPPPVAPEPPPLPAVSEPQAAPPPSFDALKAASKL